MLAVIAFDDDERMAAPQQTFRALENVQLGAFDVDLEGCDLGRLVKITVERNGRHTLLKRSAVPDFGQALRERWLRFEGDDAAIPAPSGQPVDVAALADIADGITGANMPAARPARSSGRGSGLAACEL